METKAQGYNGWTNYATWGVPLVLDNDEGSYRYVRDELVPRCRDEAQRWLVDNPSMRDALTVDEVTRHRLEDALKDYTEELCGLEDDEDRIPLMARQVIAAGLAEVNWREIAENILSES